MDQETAGKRKLIYRNFVKLFVQKFKLPSGKEYSYDIVKINDGVGVLAFLNKDTLLLQRHYRPPINTTQLEIVCGGINDGETPIQAAQRELLEETGYKGKIVYMTAGNPMAGTLDHKFHLFYATDLVKVAEPGVNEAEVFENIEKSYTELLQEILEGKHLDVPLVMSVLFYNVLKLT